MLSSDASPASAASRAFSSISSARRRRQSAETTSVPARRHATMAWSSRRPLPDRHQLGNGPIPIEHADDTPAPHLGKVAAQVVLQLGYPGLLHQALMASSVRLVNPRGREGLESTRGRDSSNLDVKFTRFLRTRPSVMR